MFIKEGLSSAERHIVDVGSIGVVIATLFSWLPNIAALLSVIWMLIRVYETKTVQRLLGRTVDD